MKSAKKATVRIIPTTISPPLRLLFFVLRASAEVSWGGPLADPQVRAGTSRPAAEQAVAYEREKAGGGSAADEGADQGARPTKSAGATSSLSKRHAGETDNAAFIDIPLLVAKQFARAFGADFRKV